jgi:hypothetical protein
VQSARLLPDSPSAPTPRFWQAPSVHTRARLLPDTPSAPAPLLCQAPSVHTRPRLLPDTPSTPSRLFCQAPSVRAPADLLPHNPNVHSSPCCRPQRPAPPSATLCPPRLQLDYRRQVSLRSLLKTNLARASASEPAMRVIDSFSLVVQYKTRTPNETEWAEISCVTESPGAKGAGNGPVKSFSTK